MMTERTANPGGLVDRAWQPLRGPFLRWPNAADFVVALFSFIMTLMLWASGAGLSEISLNSLGNAVLLLLVFVGNFALLWRRSHPVQVHAVVLLASVLVQLAPINEGIFALAFSLYSLGRYAENNRVSILGMLAALVFVATDLFVLGTPDIGGMIAACLVMVLWYVGRRLRFRGEYLRLLEERAIHLEQQRDEEAQRAVVEERTRIARELHDIVAHQVSLMTIQAGAAKTVMGTDPTAAMEAMAAVENAGRQALSEMRHLLNVLRPNGQNQHLSPQPGLSDLERLVGEVNGTGVEVVLTISGPVSGLPARLELAVFRIVQEALTNVLKHAGTGTCAQVNVNIVDLGIELLISDNGRSEKLPNHGGHGIAGMRERAETLGGTLKAQKLADRGFEVRAFLPRQGGNS